MTGARCTSKESGGVWTRCCADVAPAAIVASCHVASVNASVCADDNRCTLESCDLEDGGSCIHDALRLVVRPTVEPVARPTWLDGGDALGVILGTRGDVAVTTTRVAPAHLYRRQASGWRWDGLLHVTSSASDSVSDVDATDTQVALGARLVGGGLGVAMEVYE